MLFDRLDENKSRTDKKVVAVVAVRAGSQRIPNKNFKPFYQNKSLLEIKIESLLKVSNLDDIIINTDSSLAIEIAIKYGVSFFRREPYYASSECKNSEFFKYIGDVTDGDIMVSVPCTSPLLKHETIDKLIDLYFKLDCDSVNTVGMVKEYLWLDGRPLNYNPKKEVVPSQDLPNVVCLTHGLDIISTKLASTLSNYVGNKPHFHVLDEYEAIDINTPLDFNFAKFVYSGLQKD